MKYLACLVAFLVFMLCAMAQTGDIYNNWNFSYGRTGTPGDQLKIGLEIGKSDKLSMYGETGMEWSKYMGLRYSSFHLMAGARYYLAGNTTMSAKKKINILTGLGGIAQLESEPSLYKSLSTGDRLNYGVCGQLLGEYFYDPTIGLFAAFEQKVLFQERLGKYNNSVFVGLRIHFNNKD